MVFLQNLLEKAYFTAKMSGSAMVWPASSDFWKALLEKNVESYYSFAAVTRAQLPRYHRSHHSKMQNFGSLSVLNIWSFTFRAYLNIWLHWIFLCTALIDYVFLSTVTE